MALNSDGVMLLAPGAPGMVWGTLRERGPFPWRSWSQTPGPAATEGRGCKNAAERRLKVATNSKARVEFPGVAQCVGVERLHGDKGHEIGQNSTSSLLTLVENTFLERPDLKKVRREHGENTPQNVPRPEPKRTPSKEASWRSERSWNVPGERDGDGSRGGKVVYGIGWMKRQGAGAGQRNGHSSCPPRTFCPMSC